MTAAMTAAMNEDMNEEMNEGTGTRGTHVGVRGGITGIKGVTVDRFAICMQVNNLFNIYKIPI